ncbi:MAG: hypothetical protein GTO14_06350 [Anaerolineales bacterium]|nr:hypothetical protein [Anaerolineales bacterium]
MNVNSARSLGGACKQVLSIEEHWETIDVSTIDVEDLLQRFVAARERDYSPRTVAAYALRFKRALRLYLEYLESPETWQPPKSPVRAILEERELRDTPSVSQRSFFPKSSTSQSGTRMICYPFPLREDCIVQLQLPVELTSTDVKHLTSYLQTLVLEA